MGKLLARIVMGGGTAAGGAPVWLWVIGGLLLALAGLEGFRRVEVAGLEVRVANAVTAGEKARRAHADDRAAWEAQASEDARLNALETKRRLEKQDENQRANTALVEGLRAAAARAADAAGRLQLRLDQHLAAAKEADRAGRDPAAGVQCPATEAAAELYAELFRRADRRAGELAKYADDARAAGLKCEADYQALILKPSP